MARVGGIGKGRPVHLASINSGRWWSRAQESDKGICIASAPSSEIMANFDVNPGLSPLRPSPSRAAALCARHVPDSRFGTWFLGTETWAVHVVTRAITDLERLIKDRKQYYPVALDVGCGWGRSFSLLRDRFAATRIIGVDVDAAMLRKARRTAAAGQIEVDLFQASNSLLPIRNQVVDLILCHQTFHHLTDQRGALREFHRVLKPGGLLLFAESTKAYISSWLIRLLFRHPMEVQRTAPEYLAMLRDAGFHLDGVSYPYLWWSRSDLGLSERVLGIAPAAEREETLINAVLVRT
jgi:ubiquinone/menaquinone biosynthesis C-methylase UbiE